MSPSGNGSADMTSLDSFRCCKTLKVGSKTYAYYSLPAAEKGGLLHAPDLYMEKLVVGPSSKEKVDLD